MSESLEMAYLPGCIDPLARQAYFFARIFVSGLGFLKQLLQTLGGALHAPQEIGARVVLLLSLVVQELKDDEV